jgi:hypothetical protein
MDPDLDLRSLNIAKDRYWGLKMAVTVGFDDIGGGLARVTTGPA